MSRLRAHLKANAVGYVALVVALVGVRTAWAALGKNSVGPKQLKKNAVTRAKIAAGASTPPRWRTAGGSARVEVVGGAPTGPLTDTERNRCHAEHEAASTATDPVRTASLRTGPLSSASTYSTSFSS